MMHTLRWTWYLFRLAIHRTVAFLRFLTRLSSRVAATLLIVGASYVWSDMLTAEILHQAQVMAPGYQPEALFVDVLAVVAVILACMVYSVASGILKLTLVPFRVGMRPLPPMRKLKATKAKISNAAVRIVVPSLPRR